eukprot:m.86890 g.86890  ORF g.86890 m.86890 type:complete len:546 (-) comp26012_c0_seq1:194-1831(-)
MEISDVLGFFMGPTKDEGGLDLDLPSPGSESTDYEDLLSAADMDVDLPELLKDSLPSSELQTEDPFGNLGVDSLVSYLGYAPALSPPQSPGDMFVPRDGQLKVEPDNTAPNSPSVALDLDLKLENSIVPSYILNQKAQHELPKPTKPLVALEPKVLVNKSSDRLSDASVPPSKPTPATIVKSQPKEETAGSHSTDDGSSKRPFNSIATGGDMSDGNMDEQTLKKQRRMLKNRESAMLSRKRKKAMMEGLEAENAKLVSEKLALAKDKENLGVQVKQLETENAQLRAELTKYRPPSSSSSTVLGVLNGNGKTTTLLMCVLCLGLFRGPTSMLQTQSSQLARTPTINERYGRTLQSAEALSSPVPLSKTMHSHQRHHHQHESKTIEQTSIVSDKTELQVHQQLVGRLKNMSRSRMTDQSAIDHDGRALSSGTDLVASSGSHIQRVQQDWEIPPVFRLPNPLNAKQIRSFQKRSDTSYLFVTEVQMIAAATLNADGVPRMSVVMPAPDSEPTRARTNVNASSLSLVQIDCSVADSRAIQLASNSSVVG